MTLIEKMIAERCIHDLLAAGYSLSVYDGEETTLRRCTRPTVILAAMATTDEDYLLVHPLGANKPRIGWVRFIYGNAGWEVINDYTTNLETVLAGTNALADQLADEA